MRSYGSVKHTGYRCPLTITKNEQTVATVYANVLTHVLFNDPELKTWRPGLTVDHIDSHWEYKCQNEHWRIRWATGPQQVANRVLSNDHYVKRGSKISLGRIQWRTWIQGTPQQWDDVNIAKGLRATARETGHSASMIGSCLNDGLSHKHVASGHSYEYRLLQHVKDDTYMGERWFRPGANHSAFGWWPKDLALSDMGRLKWTNHAPTLPCKRGEYRKLMIGGSTWQYHEIAGWLFFGPRPSADHTIDHDSKILDKDGCLSNARSNLVGWADRVGQASTRTNGSHKESRGIPIAVTVKATGVVTKYTDQMSAAVALGVHQPTMCKWVSDGASRLYKIKRLPQPDLVHVRTSFSNGKLVLTTDVESWVKVKFN